MTIDNFVAFGARLVEAIACRDSKEGTSEFLPYLGLLQLVRSLWRNLVRL